MKYIITGIGYDPQEYILEDIINMPNVTYWNNPIRYESKIYKALWYRIYVYAPFLRGLLRFACKNIPKTDEDMIFIYLVPWCTMLWDIGFISRIKKVFPNSYHVTYFTDVKAAERQDMDKLKRYMNRLYIYDESEAERFDISFHQSFFSKNFKDVNNLEEIYDIAFVGHAKNRYDELIRVYEKLTDAGLKCHFYISGVPKDKQKYTDDIIYCDIVLDNRRHFEYIATARCLLELKLDSTDALTSRPKYAVIYGKKILSNNMLIKDFKYYKHRMMQYYSDVSSINVDFFRWSNESYGYEDDYSPMKFLNAITADYYRSRREPNETGQGQNN